MKISFLSLVLAYLKSTEGNISLMGGEESAPPADAGTGSGIADDAAAKLQAGLKGIYGDVVPKFPEGFDDSLKLDVNLKPFVDKEGNLNHANLLKSYISTKKMVGAKVNIPGENATAEELDEFYSKLGYAKDKTQYELKKGEKSLIQDEFLTKFKDVAHANRVPVKVAQEMINFLEKETSSMAQSEQQLSSAQIADNIHGLKEEFGKAYDLKVGLARRLLQDTLNDEERKHFSNPQVGSDPAIVRTLVKIAEKVYKEDSFKGFSDGNAVLTPQEANTKIAEIMADKKGPYWNKQDPRHSSTIREVERLYKFKNISR
jgi:hypothetical protein